MSCLPVRKLHITPSPEVTAKLSFFSYLNLRMCYNLIITIFQEENIKHRTMKGEKQNYLEKAEPLKKRYLNLGSASVQ